MKIKELKEMIKNAFIAEKTNDQYFYEPMEEINANDSLNEVDDIDFVANLEAELAEGEDKVVDPYLAEDLYEAEEEEEKQTDVTIDAEEETTNSRRRNNKKKPSDDSIVVGKKIVKLSSLSDEKQDILNSLETLRAQAEEFGDAKFETQVGNTITFFNRDFVVGGDKPTKEKVDESLEILRMRKLAGLLKEGEYAKALLNNINENTIPSVVDILKDPKLGLKHFAKLDAYDTKFKLKDDSLAIKKLPQLKGKEVEIGSYYDPRENLLTIKSGTTYTQVYPEEVEIIASTYTDNKEDYFKKNPTETLAKK